MAKKDETALAKAGQQEGQQALALATEFKALQLGDVDSVREIIQSNFGGGQISFSQLDRVKLPGAGNTTWEVITLEGERTTQELVGIIVGWADKKAWWPVSFDSGSGQPPTCRSEIYGIGIGNPTAGFNAKEEVMLKAPGITFRREPKKLAGGFDCDTCVHNQFGSNEKHGGKACQDKRLIFMLDKDSLLPFVIMAPATSIKPLREYFGRLARHALPYFGAITSIKLEKDKSAGGITYSKMVPTMVEALEGDALATARAYSRMLDPMLKQGNTMNQPALYDEEAPAGTPGTGDVLAASMADLITPKQLGLIEGLCSTRRIRADEAATSFFSQPVEVRELSKIAADRLVHHLASVPVPEDAGAQDQQQG
jgi:hypothetical protein